MIRRLRSWWLRATRSRARRALLGRRILNEALGENNGDPVTNGEYYVMDRFKGSLAGRSAVVFDVGANVGAWTLALAEGMSDGLTAYAFEPCSATFERLSGNLAAGGGGPRLVPVNAALGERAGEADLHTGEIGAGTNSLVLREAESVGVRSTSREKVRVLTGDAFCAGNGLRQLNFLKIDTEGYEIAVMRGFSGAIADGRIDLIQFEYGGTWIDARTLLADAFRILVPKGYVMGKLFPKGIQFLPEYDQRLETFQYANYVAMRPERVGLFSPVR